MELEEVQHNNMISNLPLLFANGYPTSLDKITESQLEYFIPFMVQCSLGHINLQGKIDCSEPEWWPENLAFCNPFSRPKKFVGDWMAKMKEIVMICYQFHKSSFLLRFCNDLASYEHASLRFINNYNSTTSLFDRRSNKLLVTFRNENMSYDQPQRMRKCLLQQKSKFGCQIGQQELQQIMVEPAPFDIYLCDNCDAELYSKEAFLDHEKICSMEGNDVILCDTPEPEESKDLCPQNFASEQKELHVGFMLNFNLQYRDMNKNTNTIGNNESSYLKEDHSFSVIDRNKRMPRRNRTIHSLTRCPIIPLTSPAGQLLLRSTKAVMSAEYLAERLDRMERFCQAPLLSKQSVRPKYLEKKYVNINIHCTFKKPQEYSSHLYVFPRRQFSQRRRTENFLFLNSPLIKRCRPISVRLKKISDREMRCKHGTRSKLNIKLTRDTTRSSNWKISSPATEIIVDTIDLCSSDEDDNANCAAQTALVHPHLGTDNTLVASCSTVTKHHNVANVPEMCLKEINSKFDKSSEVSLIPVHKTVGNYARTYERSSSLIKIVSSSANSTVVGKKNSLRHENNITSPLIASGSSITATKPLRPSLYIFSNYSTNPLTAIVTSPNEILPDSNRNSSNASNSNQENHLQSNVSSSVMPKRSITGNISASQDWFSGANSFVSNSLNNNNNNADSQTHSLDRERVAKSLTLIQPFSSSNVISIDLTS